MSQADVLDLAKFMHLATGGYSEVTLPYLQGKLYSKLDTNFASAKLPAETLQCNHDQWRQELKRTAYHEHIWRGLYFQGTGGNAQGLLHTYAQWKGLVINTAKSEIVHFNSKGDNVPVFTLGGARLACADSFRYLGMLLTKQRNPQATAEYMCAPFLA
eukprot:1138536-Pelagomonas_calceolata.AAC.1